MRKSGLLGQNDPRYAVFYKDGQKSALMDESTATNYAEIFGGIVVCMIPRPKSWLRLLLGSLVITWSGALFGMICGILAAGGPTAIYLGRFWPVYFFPPTLLGLIVWIMRWRWERSLQI